VKERGEAIHQLAGRKILQELEGRYCATSIWGKYDVDKQVNSGTFEDWVKREGVEGGHRVWIGEQMVLAVTNKAEDGKESVVVDDGEETKYEFVAPSPTTPHEPCLVRKCQQLDLRDQIDGEP
jgi:hypothetical protein